MCTQQWSRYKFKECGHIEDYKKFVDQCEAAKTSGKECSTKTDEKGEIMDAVGKCANCAFG
ncbi:hypothetical protein SCUCBS95973_001310 [Sporothrix curviconia]|uniref:Uncharacterized protein n=1 Tax=Sporothrix curviconia TaxID=1260050 RepID=A0ABP0AXM0_9PEZI